MVSETAYLQQIVPDACVSRYWGKHYARVDICTCVLKMIQCSQERPALP